MESKVCDFKIKGDLLFLYKFSIKTQDNGIKVAEVYFEEFGVSAIDTFQCPLPQQKSTLMKMIGGWIRNQIWYRLSAPHMDKMKDYEHEFIFPQKDKELRKIKQYVFLRSRKMAQVLGGMIWKEWLKDNTVSVEDMKEIDRISFRLQPGNKSKRMSWCFEALYNCAILLEPELWAMIKSDMSKYHTSFAKYLLFQVAHQMHAKVTHEDYIRMIKATPDIIRKCKYGFEWRDSCEEMNLHSVQAPQTRWQWFALRTALLETRFEQDKTEVQEFRRKLATSDIKVWHYFKRAHHIDKPYSTMHIHHMIRVIHDGNRIYKQNKENTYGIPFVPVEGSIMRMVRNAVYNHRQEQEFNKKRALDTRDYPMARPPVDLPEWMENLRIKTKHGMIEAGIDCQHCIGSYANSSDVFLRDGNVCCQICRHDLSIGQCYDERDQITKASETFKKKVNKALEPLRELQLCSK